MYKDIVIKKRVWMPEDDIDISNWEWCELFEDSLAQIESTIVDFNGRIPVEEAVTVGEWVTDKYKLIKADYAEILSESDRQLTPERIQEVINQWRIVECDLLPIAFYFFGNNTYAIEFSNGKESAIINIDLFQYIYEGEYEYDLMVHKLGLYGLALKRYGLVCGYVMGMNLHNADVIWQRPYSFADVEALNTIQGDLA